MTTRQKNINAANRCYGPHHAIYTAVNGVRLRSQPMYFYQALLDSCSVEKALFQRLQRMARRGNKKLKLNFDSGSLEAKALSAIRTRLMNSQELTDGAGKVLGYPHFSF